MSPQYRCRVVKIQAPLAISPPLLSQALSSACKISSGVLGVVGAGGVVAGGAGGGSGAGAGVVCTCVVGAGVVVLVGGAVGVVALGCGLVAV